MKNNYGALLAEWKVDLIINRAKMKGFRPDELEDVQQEIILKILDFRYDSSKSNGATEATVLTTLIDKQLTFIRRGQARRQKHEHAYRRVRYPGDSCKAFWIPSNVDSINLGLDLQAAIGRLGPREQTICAALAQSETPYRIAQRLGISRHTINQIIKNIRQQFRLLGLGAWVGGQ